MQQRGIQGTRQLIGNEVQYVSGVQQGVNADYGAGAGAAAGSATSVAGGSAGGAGAGAAGAAGGAPGGGVPSITRIAPGPSQLTPPPGTLPVQAQRYQGGPSNLFQGRL